MWVRIKFSSAVVATALVLAAAGADAHRIRPEEVVARLQAPRAQEGFGVVDVARDPKLPRLLVIRVGPRWQQLSTTRRRATAERWHRLWQDSVRNGIVAILDEATDYSLVSYDAHGRAILKEPSPSLEQPTP